MDFEARLHQAAQRIIPPHANSGYPPLLVYYHRRAPLVVNADNLPVFPLQADPDLLEAARWLGARADFLLIAANGPHLIQDQIEQAAGRRVLSMVELALQEVQNRGWKKVGVLGFGDPQVIVYTQPLGRLGLAFEIIGPELQLRLNAAVLRVMEGQDTQEDTGAVLDALAILRARGVDGVILGCTELPLLLHEQAEAPDLVNPVPLLAEAAVRAALV
jgi:aspartate racemase